MTIWKQLLDLDVLNASQDNTLSAYLGVRFTSFDNNSLSAQMEVNERTHQPYGIMHGGASCALAETVGSVAANYTLDTAKNLCVGLDINTSHIRSIRSGIVTATARPIHLGGSTQIWEIRIEDSSKQLISLTRLTMFVLDRSRLPV